MDVRLENNFSKVSEENFVIVFRNAHSLSQAIYFQMAVKEMRPID